METSPLLKPSSLPPPPSSSSSLAKMPRRASSSTRPLLGFRLMSGARQYLYGVALLLGVVTLWSLSDFISAALQTGDHAWNKPFLITYLNTASFAVYLIPSFFKYRRLGKLGGTHRRSDYEPLSQHDPPSSPLLRPSSPVVPVSPSRSPRSLTHPLPHIEVERGENARGAPAVPKLTIQETARVAAWWATAWFLANWTVNASLALTSVASVSILSSTSGFFTLALGKIVGVEEMTRTKVFAVLASFAGVVLVTKSDSAITPADASPALPAQPLLGDFFALISAALYAVYVIWMKVAIGDEDRADMRLLLGFAGGFSIIFLLPVIPILHVLGWEPFELPPTRSAWLICGLNMLITLSSDYMYMLAMLKTTPILVTIGISLTIPLALIGSFIIPTATPAAITTLSIGGAGMVVVAFGLLGWQEWVMSSKQIGSAVDEDEDRGRLLRRDSVID